MCKQVLGKYEMSLYNHVLLALELSSETDEHVIKKAKALAKKYGAKLTLIHAIEHMVSFGAAYSMPAGVEIEEELTVAAKDTLQDIGKRLDVSVQDQLVVSGTAKHVIVEEAKKLNADLIIVGSHGRHGVRLLLGSTANAVLHGAHCDVLAVRVSDDD